MKKILDFIKNNYKYFLLFLFILIFCLTNSLDFDELWNYGFAYNIYSGLIPYKDFNMIVPPLYPMIISIFLHINSSVLTMHLINALIVTHMFYILGKILKKNKLLILFLLCFPYNCLFPGYNLFLLYLFVLIIYFENKSNNDYIIGLLVACSILTKHVVGIFFFLSSILVVYKNKKRIFKRCLPCLGVLFIFLCYLFFTNSLNYFFDYCLFGLFDFHKSNSSYHSILIIPSLFLLITIMFKMKNNIRDYNYYYLLSFMVNIFPLFNLYHFDLFLVAYFIIVLTKKEITFKIDLDKVLIAALICLCLSNIKNSFNKNSLYPNNIKHFEYRYLESDFIKYSKEVSLAIKKYKSENKKVIIIGPDAYYFKLINDEKIDKFDLLNMGNNGYNGSEKLINSIKKQKNAVFFLNKNELGKRHQTDQELIKYILKNADKIGKVSSYGIYVLN